jgi:hypothetical protein
MDYIDFMKSQNLAKLLLKTKSANVTRLYFS